MTDSALNWADIWVLQSIHTASRSGCASSVEGIIAMADVINHAIVTFEEFNNAVYKLTNNGFLSMTNEGLKLTDAAQALFKKYSGQSYLRQSESIRKLLGIEGWSNGYDPNSLTVPELYISKGRFNNAVQTYRKI
jgi:hypothetical protein